MFLGIRSRTRKGPSVQVDYVVHIQEIAPWPPSQSLKSLRTVALQWEHGDFSGMFNSVIPSVEAGKIEFNKSFKLHVTLTKDGPVKAQDGGQYYKCLLELNLYEPRNKNVKGYHIGGAMVDLAEHGVIKKPISIGVPFSCKRSFKNNSQAIVHMKIQPVDRAGSSSSSLDSHSKEALSDKDGKESVSSLMTEEFTEEVEIASFTDDDNESQLSIDQEVSKRAGAIDKEDGTHSDSISGMAPSAEANTSEDSSACYTETLESSVDPNSGSSDVSAASSSSLSTSSIDKALESIHLDSSIEPVVEHTFAGEKKLENPHLDSSDSPIVNQTLSEEKKPEIPNCDHSDPHVVHQTLTEEKTPNPSCNSSVPPAVHLPLTDEKSPENSTLDSLVPLAVHHIITEEKGPDTNEACKSDHLDVEEKLEECNVGTIEVSHQPSEREELKHDISAREELEIEEKIEEVCSHSSSSESLSMVVPEQQHSPELTPDTSISPSRDEQGESTPSDEVHRVPTGALRWPRSDSRVFSRRSLGGKGNSSYKGGRRKSDSIPIADYHDIEDVKEIDILEDTYENSKKSSDTGHENVKHTSSYSSSNYKIQELEKRVEMLERELREIAAIEISLYSVVAEHGSSSHKVHAPARRLSRLYTYASENWSAEGRASASRSIVSGLTLAARACGNDVPRLTFWLSNSVVLKATVTPVIEGLTTTTNGNSDCHAVSNQLEIKRCPVLKWESNDRESSFSFSNDSSDWKDPKVFQEALEKIEAWIFSRIVESIWWQILIPRMQSGNVFEVKRNLQLKRNNVMSPRLRDQQRVNDSIDLWKKAFKEAYERLCPLRSEGHDCGCMPMLAKLVMEQCISRLDVAMFNAILRESDDEIPGNPLSDPITDPKVLPISVGKLSFGAGAQLKNSVGNWSRWLTDLFDIDDAVTGSEEDQDDDNSDPTTLLKTFSLLNSLSDLLMLPKDMLLDKSTRKEIFPTFSGSMIRRVLSIFIPDEFCPDSIPGTVFEALDSEDHSEYGNMITSFPFEAAPVSYSPPSMASVMLAMGHTQSKSLHRNALSMLRKCHTSDDELDELNSPLTSIVTLEKPAYTSAIQLEKRKTNFIRYQLLREVWSNED